MPTTATKAPSQARPVKHRGLGVQQTPQVRQVITAT